MKKFMTLIAIALIGTTTTFAQFDKDEYKSDVKFLNMKPSKEAKKQAKEYKNDGWKVNAGDRSMEQQITFGQILGIKTMSDEEGNTTKRYFQQTGRSTAGTYNAAYAAARSQAMVQLASTIETKIAAAMQDKIDNSQSSSISAVTVEKFHERAKSIVDQSLTNSISVLTIYRVLKNKNFEVLVTLAYDKKELTARMKRKMQKELELEGDELNSLVDKVLEE